MYVQALEMARLMEPTRTSSRMPASKAPHAARRIERAGFSPRPRGPVPGFWPRCCQADMGVEAGDTPSRRGEHGPKPADGDRHSTALVLP